MVQPVQAVSTIERIAHTYPRELSEQIWALWMRAEGTDALLDSPEKLNAFLSIAYQTSLLREEGRPVECRIALMGFQHLEHAILERAGFHPIRFTKRRMLQEYLTWYEEFPYTFSQRFVELALWLSDLIGVIGTTMEEGGAGERQPDSPGRGHFR